MSTVVLVRVLDGDGNSFATIVELKTYLKARCAEAWPPERSGTRGRPRGGTLSSLAAAMDLSPSRLHHIVSDAEARGDIRAQVVRSIARAFGDEDEHALVAHHTAWFQNRLTTTKETA